MESWDLFVLKTFYDKRKIEGYLVSISNGDTVYLTKEEYKEFLKKRKENENRSHSISSEG